MPTPTTMRPVQKPATAVRPLDFDQRLALAALAVDARLDTGALDLADVVTGPVELPAAPELPYSTPVAALLQRAARRLTVGGWCRGRMVDETRARCLYGALQGEDPGGAHIDGALRLLLEVLRREFGPGIETIPTVNDRLLSGQDHAVRVLRDAARLADARNL
jgi:hypothetical protein